MVDNTFKKQNFNTNVRVSNQTINQLKANKTFAGNVAAFKKTGMNAQQREAMNRFYGKARVSSALGNGNGTAMRTNVTAASVASNPVHIRHDRSAGARVSDWSSSTYSQPKVGKSNTVYKPPSDATKNATSSSKSFWSKAGGFVANELLGVDDLKRTANYVRKGQFGKAAKSAAAGAVELGSTIGAAAAAIPTGGGSIAAKGALIAAKQGVKVGAKAAAKQAAKSTARAAERKAVGSGLKAAGKAVVKSPVKTIGSGSIATGVKGAARTARYATSVGTHAGMQGVRAAKSVAGKAVGKAVPVLERKVASKVPTRLTVLAAKKTESNAVKALAEARASKAGKAAIKAAQSAKGKATYARSVTERAYNAANAARTYRKPAMRVKAGVLAAQGVSKVKKTARGK